MPLLRKKPASVGLSVHDDEIRLIKLKSTQQDIKIEDIGIEPLPAGAFADGNRIKRLVNQTHTQHCPTAIALPHSEVIHKHIALPAGLTHWERSLEIAENLSHYFPGMQSELHYDHVRLGALNENQDDILLVAAKLAQINEHVSAAEQAGLVVKMVDVDIYALARAVLYKTNSGSSIALIDIDTSTLQLIIVQQGKIIFQQRMTNSIANQAILRLFKTTSLFSQVEKIVLSGKSDLFFILKNFLQGETTLPVDIFNGQCESVMLTAFGLALRLL